MKDQVAFDRLVLQALSLGLSTEDFESQFVLILRLLGENELLSPLRPFAKTVFERRVLNCTKVMTYTESRDSTFYLPSSDTTSAQIATIPSRIRLTPGASDWGVLFQWNQLSDVPALGEVRTGFARLPINFAFSTNCPIAFNGSNIRDIQANRQCPGQTLEKIPWLLSSFNVNTNRGSIQFDFPSEKTEYVEVFIANTVPATMIMHSTSMVRF